MSHFSEAALEKKLGELNSTQQSIQTLSLWAIHHRKHYKRIIQIWEREIIKANEKKILTLIYLANDIIQNGRKKAPEYSKEFQSIILNVFASIGKKLNESNSSKVRRVLNVWEERNIFDSLYIKDLKKILEENDDNISENKKLKVTLSPIIVKDDKILREVYDIVDDIDYVTNELDEIEDENSIKIKTIPPVDELINMLSDLEHCPSGDAIIREKISKIPSTVSDISVLEKVKAEKEFYQLENDIREAVELLDNYNSKLGNEMERRKNVGLVLKSYLAQQKKEVEETEQKIKLYKDKLKKVNATRLELQMHLDSLPDFNFPPGLLSPSLTSDEVSTSGLYTSPDTGDTSPLRKLAPLPSPNALFSLENN